jgi:hypothetical protein
MTIIIWGTKTQRKDVGWVADLCPICTTLQTFLVSDYYKAQHVQLIRTEDWVYVATARECMQCHSELPCEKSKYARLVPVTVSEISLEELLKQSNPMHQEMRDWKDRPAGETDESELQQLNEKLAALDQSDPEIFKLNEKLKLWKKLSDKQRQEVRDHIDGLTQLQIRLLEAKNFLFLAALSYRSSAGTIGMVVFAGLMTVAIGAMFFVPWEWNWFSGSAYVGGVGFTLLFFIASAVSDATLSWFRNVLIPRARAENVPLELLLVVAVGIESWPQEEQDRTGVIGANTKLFVQTLQMELERQQQPGDMSQMP